MQIDEGSVWLFFAEPGHRGAKWLDEAGVGDYVFWRHGTDAHTKTIRAGDTALLYLSAEDNHPAAIVGIATIASVRTPFIFENDQRVQRIPALIHTDLRDRPLGWMTLAAKAGDESMYAASIRGGGSVFPVDPRITRVVSEITGVQLPSPLDRERQRISETNLWAAISEYGTAFSIFREYVTAPRRRDFEPDSDLLVTHEKEFEDLWLRGWQESDDYFASRRTQQSSEEAPARIVQDKTDALEAAETKPPESTEDSTQASDLTPDDARSQSTMLGLNSGSTALSIADRVEKHADDHLEVRTEAKAFARLIASEGTKPPLSIGIFGRWGSGKTFFMNEISEELEEIAKSEREGFHNGIVQADFNAWHYMETNVWASLVDVIFKRLDAELPRDADDTSPTLFDQLSTAQNLRMDAIETLAKSIADARTAREGVKMAREHYRENGPNGRAIWDWVRGELGKEINAQGALAKAASELGYSNVVGDVERLRDFAKDVAQTRKNGMLTVRMLRKHAASPQLIFCFAALVSFFALFLLFAERATELGFVVSTIVTGATSWGGCVALLARRSIGLVQAAGEKLAAIEATAQKRHEQIIDGAEFALQDAERNLEFATEHAEQAYEALVSESPGARLASFIRERAESDDYTKHLGVIATIRKDFEQLTELMLPEDAAKQPGGRQLARFRSDVRERIDTLRRVYSMILDSDENSVESVRLSEAIDELERTLDDKLKTKRPFTRIVLKIDDLDRCPPDKVADVLQAVHLFLNFPLFVVLVCVDERWMSSSLVEKYKNLVDGTSGATTSDYLEKIFQIPYWTRPMNAEASGAFAEALVGRVKRPDVADDAGEVDKALELVTTDKLGTHSTGVRTRQSPNKDAETVQPVSPEDTENDATTVTEKTGNTPDTGAGGQNIAVPDSDLTYEPLTLSDEERRLIRKAAGIAGDTPRRTLRFVNVYLLIKSSFGHQANDPLRDAFRAQALLIQLALATRADPLSGRFFREIDRIRVSQDDLPDLETFLESLLNSNGKDEAPDQVEDPEAWIAREQLIDLILDLLGCFVHDWEKLGVDRYGKLLDSDANRQFVPEMLATERYARRYTFVPHSAYSEI